MELSDNPASDFEVNFSASAITMNSEQKLYYSEQSNFNYGIILNPIKVSIQHALPTGLCTFNQNFMEINLENKKNGIYGEEKTKMSETYLRPIARKKNFKTSKDKALIDKNHLKTSEKKYLINNNEYNNEKKFALLSDSNQIAARMLKSHRKDNIKSINEIMFLPDDTYQNSIAAYFVNIPLDILEKELLTPEYCYQKLMEGSSMEFQKLIEIANKANKSIVFIAQIKGENDKIISLDSILHHMIPVKIYDKFMKFYAMDSHTSQFEGSYGLKHHTDKVIKNFKTFYQDNFTAKTGISSKLMINLLALHDIGKGLSSDTKEQHANTKNVIKAMKQELTELGIEKNERNFMVSIITQDPIGELFKPLTIKEDQAAIILNDHYLKAKKYMPNIDKKQFFNLMIIFYACDAGSYSYLRTLLLNNEEGSLENFKPEYATKLTKLEDIFMQDYAVKDHTQQIRYHNDEHLFVRDFEVWFKNNQNDFPKSGVVVFDIDGTITGYQNNTIKPYMRTIIQKLVEAGIRIKFVTNRTGERETNECTGGDLHQELQSLIKEPLEIFYNGEVGNKYINFKNNWYKNQEFPIIATFGDNLNDLHGHRKGAPDRFKSKSFWVQIGKAGTDFKSQREFANV